MKKELLGLALAATLVAGCGEKAAEHPETEARATDIYNSSKVVQVGLGQTSFLKVVDEKGNLGKDLVARIPIVDHQYPNGPSDDKAPQVTSTPMRVDVQVTLQGKSPELANDAACETLRIEGQPKYIGAVAIGGHENGVFMSRPADNPGFVYICSFQDMEPASENGIVIFSSENDR